MSRNIRIKAQGEDCNALDVSFNYQEGGCNWYYGKTESRGIYVSVTPVKVIQNDGYSVVQQELGKGGKMLMVELTRRNKKKLEALEFTDPRVKECIQYVCNQYNITVLDEDWA